MARKRREPESTIQSAPVRDTAGGVRTMASSSGAAAAGTTDELHAPPFGLRHYLLWNAVFVAFCVFQLVVVRLVVRETQGLYFFFGVLIAAFALVSVFDYAYDRLIDPPSRENET